MSALHVVQIKSHAAIHAEGDSGMEIAGGMAGVDR